VYLGGKDGCVDRLVGGGGDRGCFAVVGSIEQWQTMEGGEAQSEILGLGGEKQEEKCCETSSLQCHSGEGGGGRLYRRRPWRVAACRLLSDAIGND